MMFIVIKYINQMIYKGFVMYIFVLLGIKFKVLVFI